MSTLLLWVLVGCGEPRPVATVPDPPMHHATLTIGGGDEPLTVFLAGAWVDPDGDGAGVDATAEIPGTPPLTITGHRSSWSLDEGLVVFEGEVRATRGALELECDRLEVVYAAERVARAVATGTVQVVLGDRKARSDQATLTTADGSLELTGDPRIEDGPNRLAGERIVLFLDDERMECERCRLDVAAEALR